jgi:pilus assembly protein Flp/PilA
MGETQPNGGLSDAAGGRAAGGVAARSVVKFARRFSGDQSGATAIEYGLIISLIFLTIVGAVTNFAGRFNNMMTVVSTNVGGAL